jgi:hypothetical protein
MVVVVVLDLFLVNITQVVELCTYNGAGHPSFNIV